MARALGVSSPTVAGWVDSGKLPGHRTPGGHRRILQEDFERFAATLARDASAREAHAEPRPNVVVVDGLREYGEMVKEFLELQSGLRVQFTSDPFEAGLLIGQLRPAVVLLDLGLRVVNAQAMAWRIRADPQLAHTRLISCSALLPEEQARLVEQGLIDAYAIKPVQLTALAELVARQISEIGSG